MTAGLPGTAIGGLFYLANSLLMPFRELMLTLRGRSSQQRWRVIAVQGMIAAGVILSMLLMGWIIGLIFEAAGYVPFKRLIPSSSFVSHFNVLWLSPLVITSIILSGVLFSVHLLRFILWAVSFAKTALSGKSQA
jgi:hypothetical protein